MNYQVPEGFEDSIQREDRERHEADPAGGNLLLLLAAMAAITWLAAHGLL